MLSTIKRPPKLMDYKVYDMEWYPKSMELRLIGVYDGGGHTDYGTSLSAFLDGELIPENTGKVYFAHAGGLADMQYVFDEIIMRKPDWRVTASFSGSSAIIVRVEDEGGNRWTFGDSLWLLRDSLDAIGKSVGLHKGGSDYYCSNWPGCGHSMKRGSCVCADLPLGSPCPRGRKCKRKPTCIFYAPLPILREYNRRDNEVLYLGLDRLQREIVELGSELKMTTASTAMTLFRRRFLSNDIKTRKRVNLIARKAYVASRVEVFTPEMRVDRISCFDVNSSFPKSMTEPQPGHYRGASRTWSGSRLSLVDARVTVPEMYLPPLPVRIQKKKSAPPRVFFPVGTWRGWYAGSDLELLLEAGGKIERVYKTLDFEPFHDLRAYVELIYERRRKEEDPFRKLVYKLLLNSLYGKFSEQSHKESLLVRPDQPPPDGSTALLAGVYLAPTDVPVPHEHVPVGVQVTSLSRALLYRFMAKCADLYYCDTDSIFTTSSLPSGDALGALKHEYDAVDAYFAAPKFYRVTVEEKDKSGEIEYVEKVKAKGFSSLRRQDFDALVAGESVTYDRMVRIRENLRRYGDTTPREAPITKSLRLREKPKRCLLPNGQTRPWTYEEIVK